MFFPLKKTLQLGSIFFIGVFVYCLSVFLPAQALASGVNTSTGTGSGQVRVNQDGTTTYLSTQTNGGTSTVSARTQTSTRSAFGLSFNASNLPEGFFDDPEMLITNLINIAFIISILLAFFYLIWAGFDWITSGGDKSKIDSARQKIINVVIGLVVVAASYALLTLALQLLGYSSVQDALTETERRISP